MERRVDYDAVAGRYDRRYRENNYSGVERALLAFLGAPRACALEAGCGAGYWLAVLDAAGHAACGIDASRGMLAQARTSAPRATLLHARAERLPLRDASVDRAFCVNAFHHFDDKPAFVAEARRVLRPGGGLFVLGLDPHTGLDRWWVYDAFAPVLAIDRRRYPPRQRGSARPWRRQASRGPRRRSRSTCRGEAPRARSSPPGGWTGAGPRSSPCSRMPSSPPARHSCVSAWRPVRGAELVLQADLRLYATTGWLA